MRTGWKPSSCVAGIRLLHSLRFHHVSNKTGFSATASPALQVPTVAPARVEAGDTTRTPEERAILEAHHEQTVVLELQVRLATGL